ncbi:translation initiation factor IF-2 [Microvirga tunisiensis]|uniref:Translation initiation factor IF-2 n=2 Tax=Pannonibacter tanglangensis TaxID=2750084 RepID=A0ABW9ZLF9_9HYPH|nr:MULTISPECIES: translation initiation factor IF-2 [unclassified Pannonibacter]NBN65755.1 translation initiation factor IF-2 [Pannonibacter sp. XCT-34]NBN80018.1 translation initiation factor IF-2 [Pannonibacter sp. XCT-53]
MNDTKNPGDKTISVERKTLGLKRGGVEQGTVRQSFSHGRSKAVVVEKKKRRVVVPGQEGRPEAEAAAPAPVERPREPAPAAPQSQPQTQNTQQQQPQQQRRPQQGGQPQRPQQRSGGGTVLRSLTQEEAAARMAALKQAQEREVEERKRAEEDARRRAIEEAQRKAEEEARAKAEEEARKIREAEEAARRAAEPDLPAPVVAEKPAAAAAPAPRPAAPAAAARPAPAGQGQARKPEGTTQPQADRPRPAGAPVVAATEDEDDRKGGLRSVKRPKAPVAPVAKRGAGDDRRRSKLTISAATGGSDEQRSRSLASLRRRREKEKRGGMQTVREKISREVILPEAITIQELANRMAERSVDVIKLLMKQGQMLKINDVIDADTAELIASELGHTVKRVSEADVEEGLFSTQDDDEVLVSRPPVVTIMGHVDHGKTSLLDAIRNSKVVSGEAGGITQHIGAYQVEKNGQKITFIDTPGHAAFTQMRARGAKATDIVILVVAADDGVMPQTKEAISHAKAAGVPIIVAINKIDKPSADPNRVRTELLHDEIVVESMGGDTIDVEVSAKVGTNLDRLLEMVLLQAEVLELRANPDRTAEGLVIEAQLDKGRGPVATVLVQKGTLRVGDILVAGGEWGKVRALLDEDGNQVKEAGPSKPVEVLGFQGTPEAGDMVAVVENESRAREIADYRQRQKREKLAVVKAGTRASLEQMMSRLQSGGRKEFPLVIKADVQGSAEAIAHALDKVGNEEVGARVLFSGVGGITESDITLATASNASIIAFNVRANKQAREAADREGIEIRYYNVIYDLVDDVKAAMSGMLAPERRETFIGYAEIREIFDITKVGKVAGCLVTEGVVERGAEVRLIRDNVVVHEGKLGTLKRFKDDVKSVESGQECGMNFVNYQDMRVGDVIECFRVEQIARSL